MRKLKWKSVTSFLFLAASPALAAPTFGQFCVTCENPNRPALGQTAPALAALTNSGLANELRTINLGFSVRSLEQLQAEGLNPKAPVIPTWNEIGPQYHPSFAGVLSDVPDFGQSTAPITPTMADIGKNINPWRTNEQWIDVLDPTFRTPWSDNAGFVAYLNQGAPWMYGQADNRWGIAGIGGF